MDEISKIKYSVELCNKRDILKNEIDNYDELINFILPTVKEYKKSYFNEKAPRTLFLILSIFLGLLLALCIFSNGTTIGAVSVFFMIAIYNFIFKPLYYSVNKSKFSEFENVLTKASQEKPQLIILRKEKFSELSLLEQYMKDENNCIIPYNYWDNANFIYNLIQNKRAVDLVSAINKFEDIMHQMRIENMAQTSLELQQITAYNSAIAAENSEIAATNSHTAAVNSGISAYLSIINYIDNN